MIDTQPAAPAWIRRTGITAVSSVAAVAAIVSYDHMRTLAAEAGEGWKAYALPVSVDGMIVAASLVMLTRRRAGLSAGWLAWVGLALGLVVSLVANVAAAEPTLIGRLVAAWPPLALGVSYELLLTLVRPADARSTDEADEADEAVEIDRPAVEPIVDQPVVKIDQPVADQPVVMATIVAHESTVETSIADPIAESIIEVIDRSTDRRPPTRSTRRPSTSKAPRRSIEQLRVEARDLIDRNGWSADQVTAEALRTGLKIAPVTARQLRDEYRAGLVPA